MKESFFTLMHKARYMVYICIGWYGVSNSGLEILLTEEGRVVLGQASLFMNGFATAVFLWELPRVLPAWFAFLKDLGEFLGPRFEARFKAWVERKRAEGLADSAKSAPGPEKG